MPYAASKAIEICINCRFLNRFTFLKIFAWFESVAETKKNGSMNNAIAIEIIITPEVSGTVL
jgi:hypothetical protein